MSKVTSVKKWPTFSDGIETILPVPSFLNLETDLGYVVQKDYPQGIWQGTGG